MTLQNHPGGVNESPDRNETVSEFNKPTTESPEEAAVKAKMTDRKFRDSVIEKEEKQWNTPAKQDETIKEEKTALRAAMNKYAPSIEKAIKERKEPLLAKEELPDFLRKCGVAEEDVSRLEDAFPDHADGPEPQYKHMVNALYETINSLCKQDSFLEGSFINKTMESFEDKRRATFIEDDTDRAKYLDRLGQGFYPSAEGQKFMYEKATESVNPEAASEAT